MNEIKVSVVRFGDRKALQMQYVDPITRKKKTRSTGETTQRGAERAAAKWEADLREGRYHAPSKLTWAEFKERYEAEVLGGLSNEWAKTVYTTFRFIEAEHEPNPRSLRDFTAESISRWIAKLLAGDRKATTVGLYCRVMRAVLNWAKEMGFIHAAPKIREPKIDRTGRLMKGRPIVLEEHERMLAVVVKVVPAADVPAWQQFLNGLWWSGLRLGEAVGLSWDATADVSVEIDAYGRAMLRFQAAGQKARRAELLPCAPEFSKLLAAIPEAQRTGYVFDLEARTGTSRRPTVPTVGRLISTIGEMAGIIVHEETGKHATAHDYRRAFGTRWAKRVMPATLQRLMRHREIGTTMKYYVQADVNEMAGDLWAAFEKADTGNTFGNKSVKPASNPEEILA